MEKITAEMAGKLSNEDLLKKLLEVHKDSITSTGTCLPVLKEEMLTRLNKASKKGNDETDGA